ncbi:ABC transporter substrate-binding protein [Flavobacterium beibuense F44-8]|uniref:ABC transporter substrate-binding protein n=1 Tax=Flavobacterium beibuense F44-8 TaxID=1406840 RepID=A0A0A2LPI5_9FLAO|nr:T9SS type A sorting domain-containing protein [Flavobacterium beibuense]KGO81138.1 ABC transporter substrate-binding protein [Flavobacterium beibuense F44-8]
MKRVLTILILSIYTMAFAQSNQSWRSYFSYNQIVDITNSPSRVFAAGEVGAFSYNVLTNELGTFTSVDGLKTENITAIYHSNGYSKTLVGNENGLLLVINDDNSILNVIDIVEETTVAQNKKKINHIYEYEGKAYISCDFGIAVFNLQTLEFGDTYYLGPNGAEIAVKQSAVYNGYIYAATAENGIRRAVYTNPNLNDFSQWNEFASGQYTGVVSFAGNLFATDAIGTVYRLLNDTFSFFTAMPEAVVDFRSAGGYLIITTPGLIDVYNEQLMLMHTIDSIPIADVTFSCTTIVNEKIYTGTTNSGLFTAALNNLSFFVDITPDGPLENRIFSLEKSANNLWAVYGGYNIFYTPDYALKGISRFTSEGWKHIPFYTLPEYPLSLSDIVVKPGLESPVYIASYQSGLLKLTGGEPEILYDDSNTGNNGLESLVLSSAPDYKSIRINGPTFDRNGNLWMTNSSVLKPLKVLRSNGQWAEYSFEDITSNPEGDDYGRLVIDKNGTKWIPSENNGIIAFNESLGNKFVVIRGDASNLPSDYVKCLTIDNRNQLWVGTVRGLRVVSSVERFVTENEISTNSIIILEDGLAQELMYEQVINDIVVDGANNKWIATGGSGAFLVSSNGQQTLFHFTKQNSPLPSNSILDIELDPVTGEVFFATEKGMVSYLGNSTAGEDDLNNVYVYPNPVRPEFAGDVTISGLMDKVNLKITDIEGNLVYETTSQGGTVTWDTKAFGKYKVASGVYMIFISSDDGTKTKVKKVMIIRGQ